MARRKADRNPCHMKETVTTRGLKQTALKRETRAKNSSSHQNGCQESRDLSTKKILTPTKVFLRGRHNATKAREGEKQRGKPATGGGVIVQHDRAHGTTKKGYPLDKTENSAELIKKRTAPAPAPNTKNRRMTRSA